MGLAKPSFRTDFKPSEAGLIPEDWRIVALEDITVLMTNGYVGPAKQHYVENESGVLYIQGYNVLENGFDFHGIKYVKNSFHRSNQKSCLREHDLLTVQTGDVGLTTIVPKNLAGSNCHALIISRFDLRRINPKYISFYLNSKPGRARLRLIETGTTMKHLNVGDVLKFTVPIPPTKDEQDSIATVLSDTDALISSLEKLIEKKRNIKQGVMQKLLLPTSTWQVRRLGDLLTYEQPARYIVKSTDYLASGQVPVLTPGKTFILGYTNETFGVYDDPPVIIFDDFTTASRYVDFKFKVKSSAIKLLKSTSHGNLRFLFEVLQTIRFDSSDHKRYWISNFQNMAVKVPDLDEQSRIARLCSSFEEEIAELTRKLLKSKLLKQALMQTLLTGKIRLTT